jgi:catechol 2,3-dioxygenase-like lactoylglutathione lyase family enzyme
MLKRITHSTLYVKDQNETLRFYTEALGFEVRNDTTAGDFRWLTVGLPSQPDFEIVLFPLKADDTFLTEEDVKTLTKLAEGGKLGTPVVITDDIHKTYEEFTAKGVKFTGPPNEQPWGIDTVFMDNNGNMYSLQQEGHM